MQGRVYAPPQEPDADSEAIREFNEVVVGDARVETVTLPVRDGMSLVRPHSPPHPAASINASAGAAGMPPGGMGNPQTPMRRVTSASAHCIGRCGNCILSPAAFASFSWRNLKRPKQVVPGLQQRCARVQAITGKSQPGTLLRL